MTWSGEPGDVEDPAHANRTHAYMHVLAFAGWRSGLHVEQAVACSEIWGVRVFRDCVSLTASIVDHGVDHDRGGEAGLEARIAPPMIHRT